MTIRSRWLFALLPLIFTTAATYICAENLPAPATTESKGFSRKEMTCEVLPIFRDLYDGSILEDPGKTERAAWIVRQSDGKLSSVRWPHLGARYKITWKYQLPRQTLAQVHTHPRTASPQPSDEDRRQAMRLGLPIYVISRKGIWVVNPDGTTIQQSGSGWAKEQLGSEIEKCGTDQSASN